MNAGIDFDTVPHVPPIQRLCRYLSERSPQPMLAVEGTTHIITYANPAFARLVDRERRDLVGRPFADAVPEGERNGCVALLDRVFRTGLPENLLEQEHRHASPEPVYWSYAVWAILGEDATPSGVMIQVTDSTETARFRQQAVAMNEALLISATHQHELVDEAGSLATLLRKDVASRDHFLAVLSHEIRNPLSALANGLGLLRVEGNDPASVDECQAMMGRQLKRLERLLDDLLDVSRITAGKQKLEIERADLGAIAREAVESCRPLMAELGHRLTVTIPTEPVALDADPVRITQVILNLLNNAAKYTDPGGRIALTVRREGNEVVARVRDNGIGLAASQLSRVFDVFVQLDPSWGRSQGGLGIGLSLVKEFVGLHGGSVEARSDGPGTGSEFIVRLPAAAESTSAVSPPPAAAGKPRGPSRKVLVVDDNRDAADSLARFLKRLGHETRAAYDGAAGVATASEFRPEVILMDLGMPVMDGYEAARRIHSETRDAAPLLVALSGWGSDEDRRRSSEAGFQRHLVKPVRPDDLARLIAELPTDAPN